MSYITGTCKYCKRAFISENITNNKSYPNKYLYCPECCDKYGFENDKALCKKQLTQQQLDNLAKGRETLQNNRRLKQTSRLVGDDEN